MEGSYVYKYPHPAVTTDCVIFGYDTKDGLSVLLVKRGIEPFKDCWAFPGGFIKMDEDAETGARRELKEVFSKCLTILGASLVAWTVKNLPAMQETQV